MSVKEAHLFVALERWREADWHWKGEFLTVCKHWHTHVPDDPVFIQLSNMLSNLIIKKK